VDISFEETLYSSEDLTGEDDNRSGSVTNFLVLGSG